MYIIYHVTWQQIYIYAILPKTTRKCVKKIQNFGHTTPDFFGSLGVAEHEKNSEQALSIAKLFCRQNQYLIFYSIFSLHFEPLPFGPGRTYIIFQKEIETRKNEL